MKVIPAKIVHLGGSHIQVYYDLSSVHIYHLSELSLQLFYGSFLRMKLNIVSSHFFTPKMAYSADD